MLKVPSDETTSIADLRKRILTFTLDREWDQFHNPKDLAVALAIEVGEVLEHFRFRSDKEIESRLQDENAKRELAHEIADCLWLILRMADVVGFDISSALYEKLELAEAKYPAEIVRGRPDKYTAYQNNQPSKETQT